MKLIINADDFGYSKGVNLGIIEAYQNGVVRSTTMMTGMDGFAHAVMLSRENPDLHIGIHLTLTCGKSLGAVYKTITDSEGNFHKLSVFTQKLNANEIDVAEIEQEYEAQIQRAVMAGISFDHFDSHHHTHLLPAVFPIFLKLAKKYNVAVRLYSRKDLPADYQSLKSPEAFSDTLYGDTANIEHFEELINQNRAESLEIMCHPAYVDAALYKGSSYAVQRAKELELLTNPRIKTIVQNNVIHLSSFSNL